MVCFLCGVQVPRPDGKVDSLGLLVLDEPSVKQSDPTVLSLWLSEETKQHGAAEVLFITDFIITLSFHIFKSDLDRPRS